MSLSVLWNQKWPSVLTVTNLNNLWDKPELDVIYLAHECNNRVGGLLSLLPFFKKNIAEWLINQKLKGCSFLFR